MIVLTASQSPAEVAAAYGGADDCLAMPFQLTELLARIRLRPGATTGNP